MNKVQTTRAEALLWSVIIAAILTGGVHAAAMVLPDWITGHGARQSAVESAVTRFSEYWLMNAVWLGGATAAIACVVMFALLRRRPKSSSPPGNDAG